jgi:hypothetical protein
LNRSLNFVERNVLLFSQPPDTNTKASKPSRLSSSKSKPCRADFCRKAAAYLP